MHAPTVYARPDAPQYPNYDAARVRDAAKGGGLAGRWEERAKYQYADRRYGIGPDERLHLRHDSPIDSRNEGLNRSR